MDNPKPPFSSEEEFTHFLKDRMPPQAEYQKYFDNVHIEDFLKRLLEGEASSFEMRLAACVIVALKRHNNELSGSVKLLGLLQNVRMGKHGKTADDVIHSINDMEPCDHDGPCADGIDRSGLKKTKKEDLN